MAMAAANFKPRDGSVRLMHRPSLMHRRGNSVIYRDTARYGAIRRAVRKKKDPDLLPGRRGEEEEEEEEEREEEEESLSSYLRLIYRAPSALGVRDSSALKSVKTSRSARKQQVLIIINSQRLMAALYVWELFISLVAYIPV